MTRTIISIPEDEKQWLESYGRRHHISGAEVVRRAIRDFRKSKSGKNLAGVIQETAGSWSSVKGDTRILIDAMRDDWERGK